MYSFKGWAIIGPDEEREQLSLLVPSFSPHWRTVGPDGWGRTNTSRLLLFLTSATVLCHGPGLMPFTHSTTWEAFASCKGDQPMDQQWSWSISLAPGISRELLFWGRAPGLAGWRLRVLSLHRARDCYLILTTQICSPKKQGEASAELWSLRFSSQ